MLQPPLICWQLFLGEIHTVKHSETVYCLEPDTNLEYDTELFRWVFLSSAKFDGLDQSC